MLALLPDHKTGAAQQRGRDEFEHCACAKRKRDAKRADKQNRRAVESAAKFRKTTRRKTESHR